MSSYGATGAPFATSAETRWQVSTTKASYCNTMPGDALAKHKDELNRAKGINKWMKGNELQKGTSPFGQTRKQYSLDMPYFTQQRSSSCANPRAPGGLADRNNENSLDVFPNASRGIRGGGMQKWSFDRVPSLMPAPLKRDTTKRGVYAASGTCGDSGQLRSPSTPSRCSSYSETCTSRSSAIGGYRLSGRRMQSQPELHGGQ
eukprot:TRINITY_DN27596_c0_g1_i1.p1 TRINITY_DN27596_c0_g1~~TRINITY_DN27596_c0_g1_i1.p1  ORF type:complete len:203 (-),score=25.39 TRINITY_DN27596_c0_g1_i1:267-875(-)